MSSTFDLFIHNKHLMSVTDFNYIHYNVSWFSEKKGSKMIPLFGTTWKKQEDKQTANALEDKRTLEASWKIITSAIPPDCFCLMFKGTTNPVSTSSDMSECIRGFIHKPAGITLSLCVFLLLRKPNSSPLTHFLCILALFKIPPSKSSDSVAGGRRAEGYHNLSFLDVPSSTWHKKPEEEEKPVPPENLLLLLLSLVSTTALHLITIQRRREGQRETVCFKAFP